MGKHRKKNKNRYKNNASTSTALAVIEGGKGSKDSPIVTSTKSTTSSKKKSGWGYTKEPPKEIWPGFFLGSLSTVSDLVSTCGADILVPLDSIYPSVWDTGFRGEIFYYPMKDFGCLPDDVATMCCNKVVQALRSGKKVGMFCVGGRGRTGTMAALVLGFLGVDDPIALIRDNYKADAIESSEQINQVARLLDKPALKEKHAAGGAWWEQTGAWGTKWGSYYDSGWGAYDYPGEKKYNYYQDYDRYLKSGEVLKVEREDEIPVAEECKTCIWNEDNYCSAGEELRHKGECPECYSLQDYLEEMADADAPEEGLVETLEEAKQRGLI